MRHPLCETVGARLARRHARNARHRTAFVERHNGTDRNRNRRKVRKTYCFSKDWQVHEAMTYFTMYSYNFCWPVRTLRREVGPKRYEPRTPAMVAGLTDHVWTIQEWAAYPARRRIRDK